MTVIQHINLNTGITRSINRFQCNKEKLAICEQMLATVGEQPISVPFSEICHLQLQCFIEGTMLRICISAPVGPHTPGEPFQGDTIPLSVFTVSPQADDEIMWHTMTESYRMVFREEPVGERPQTAAMVAMAMPSILFFSKHIDAIADFQNHLGWAWLKNCGHKPKLVAVS